MNQLQNHKSKQKKKKGPPLYSLTKNVYFELQPEKRIKFNHFTKLTFKIIILLSHNYIIKFVFLFKSKLKS